MSEQNGNGTRVTIRDVLEAVELGTAGVREDIREVRQDIRDLRSDVDDLKTANTVIVAEAKQRARWASVASVGTQRLVNIIASAVAIGLGLWNLVRN